MPGNAARGLRQRAHAHVEPFTARPRAWGCLAEEMVDRRPDAPVHFGCATVDPTCVVEGHVLHLGARDSVVVLCDADRLLERKRRVGRRHGRECDHLTRCLQ